MRAKLAEFDEDLDVVVDNFEHCDKVILDAITFEDALEE